MIAMSGPGSAPIALGTVLFGKYRVERILGQGGMGVVVAARHLELGELFAIKFMLPAALSSSESIERFVREARAVARLRSEHVVKVYDVGRLDDGAPYMVMEHLSGKDLKGVVAGHRPLPVPEAIDYVLQACDAMEEAHSLGIVHRDLKPANLFLTTRPNGTPCVKVLDFGISKQTGQEASRPLDMTATADIMGSPLYMSPEQMRSTKSADARTDVWAFGVILYQLMSGEMPFNGRGITEVCASVFQEHPAPLGQWIPGISPALEAVVMQCLEKDAARRFPTAGALAEALRRAATLEEAASTTPFIRRELPDATTMLRVAPAAAGTASSWKTRVAPIKRSSSAVPAALATAGGALVLAVVATMLFSRERQRETVNAPLTNATSTSALPAADSGSASIAAPTAASAASLTVASASAAPPASSPPPANVPSGPTRGGSIVRPRTVVSNPGPRR